MAKTSPTARELAYLRKRGITAQVVERFNRFSNTRKDLFGVLDVVALDGDIHLPRIVGIQVTAGASHAARRTKIEAEPLAVQWITHGGLLWLVSWSKQGGKGKRKLWTRRCERAILVDGKIQWETME